MDCYFLKVKITEFTFIENFENNKNRDNTETNNNTELINNDNNNNYEIEFELTKSNEKFILKLINDNNGNKIPVSKYFTLPTSINIDKDNNDISSNYIESDLLEISLYSNNEEKKLVDIDNDILIDSTCINEVKYGDIYLGNYHLIFLFKLSLFEDLCVREGDMNYMANISENKDNNIELENINYNENNLENVNNNKDEEEEEDLVEKYHNLLGNKPIEDDIIYDDELFQEIEPIDLEFDKEKINSENEKKNNLNELKTDKNDSPGEIYHDIKNINFFDINVDIFEEEEIEEDEENINDNEKGESNILKNKNDGKINYKIYKNTNLIMYENIILKKPKLKEIINYNLFDCFLISGLSKNKKSLKNSESYAPQCKHKNCQYNKSYYSEIIYRLQKPNSSNISKIESSDCANLIFPYGIKICYGENYLNHLFKTRNSTQFQEPEYSFNVLTDIKGKRYYIYSLIFFIQFEFKEFIKYFKDYKDINIKSSSVISKENYKIYVPFAFSIISKIYDLENIFKILNDLYSTFYSSQMDNDNFDNELIHLIFEVPSPPLNSKIKLYLPYTYVEIKHNIYENKIFNNLNYCKIFFQKNSYSIGFIIKIFILILLERKILLHSSNENKIYETIESILNLIYPLKWVNTYIPLIPDENINLILQSFLPFIIGVTHQSFFNYANKIEKLNSGNNNQDEVQNYDNIFIINLDTENILPTTKINELIKICPIYEKIEDEYLNLKSSGEIDNEKIRNIFLEGMVELLGDYEKFTSKLDEYNLFNQKIYLRNQQKKYMYFFQQITSTQQFYQFINEINNNEDLYYQEFLDKIKIKNNSKRKKIIEKNNIIVHEEEIYMDEYFLYPYFFKKENKNEIDIFNFEDEIDLYYNCLNKEHKINYLLDTEAFIRFKLILQNYIPYNLKKYEIKKKFYPCNRNHKNKNELFNLYNSNYDSNLSMPDLENNNFSDITNIFGNIYGKMKNSVINNIFSNINDKENKENVNNNIQNLKQSDENTQKNKKENKVEYRRRDSLINMIRNNCNKSELLKYKEQIIDLLKDYMGYIFSNEREDIPFSLDELSKLFTYRRIRREFSKILYQTKFDNNIEHELSEETFDLLNQTVFFCLVNLSTNKNEYRVLRRIIKSMFYYFYKNSEEQKIFLYQKILEKNEKFYFARTTDFWKYYYKIENLEFPEEDNFMKIKNIMNKINIDSSILDYLE